MPQRLRRSARESRAPEGVATPAIVSCRLPGGVRARATLDDGDLRAARATSGGCGPPGAGTRRCPRWRRRGTTRVGSSPSGALRRAPREGERRRSAPHGGRLRQRHRGESASARHGPRRGPLARRGRRAGERCPAGSLVLARAARAATRRWNGRGPADIARAAGGGRASRQRAHRPPGGHGAPRPGERRRPGSVGSRSRSPSAPSPPACASTRPSRAARSSRATSAIRRLRAQGVGRTSRKIPRWPRTRALPSWWSAAAHRLPSWRGPSDSSGAGPETSTARRVPRNLASRGIRSVIPGLRCS